MAITESNDIIRHTNTKINNVATKNYGKPITKFSDRFIKVWKLKPVNTTNNYQLDSKYRHKGLESVVYHKEGCAFLFFADFDTGFYDVDKAKRFVKWLEQWTSFFSYNTLNGGHVVGLTALDARQWGLLFYAYQKEISKKYDGRIIRLTKKQNEVQRITGYSFKLPVVKPVYDLFKIKFPVLPALHEEQFSKREYSISGLDYYTKNG